MASNPEVVAAVEARTNMVTEALLVQIDLYDAGEIALSSLKSGVRRIVAESISKTYDEAFAKGVEDAELGGDEEDEYPIVDFEGYDEEDIR